MIFLPFCDYGRKVIKLEVYIRDDNLLSNSGILNLHAMNGAHFVLYNNQFFFTPKLNSILIGIKIW